MNTPRPDTALTVVSPVAGNLATGLSGERIAGTGGIEIHVVEGDNRVVAIVRNVHRIARA